MTGGEGGIRTPGTLSGTPVFKTGAINHSATSPAENKQLTVVTTVIFLTFSNFDMLAPSCLAVVRGKQWTQQRSTTKPRRTDCRASVISVVPSKKNQVLSTCFIVSPRMT